MLAHDLNPRKVSECSGELAQLREKLGNYEKRRQDASPGHRGGFDLIIERIESQIADLGARCQSSSASSSSFSSSSSPGLSVESTNSGSTLLPPTIAARSFEGGFEREEDDAIPTKKELWMGPVQMAVDFESRSNETARSAFVECPLCLCQYRATDTDHSSSFRHRQKALKTRAR